MPHPRTIRAAAQALLFTVGVSAVAVSTAPAASAQEPAPVMPEPMIKMTLRTTGLSSYQVSDERINGGLLDWSKREWFLDGTPIPNVPKTPSFWLYEPRDGKQHTLTVRYPRKDVPGTTYEVSRTYVAPRPLTISAPVQSARIARARGIAVRVSAAYGYYRVRTQSKRIPAAASVNVEGREGGEKRAWLRGSYLDRIQPGTRLKIRAQRHYRGSILETAVITVRFR